MDNEVTQAGDLWVDAWFSLWYQPRATMRLILDTDPRKFVLPIAFVAGVVAAISQAVTVSLSEPSNIPNMPHLPHLGPIGLGLGAILEGLVSIVSLYGLAALYRWTGHKLGGTADKIEMRSALAWGLVPGLYLEFANILMVVLGLA